MAFRFPSLGLVLFGTVFIQSIPATSGISKKRSALFEHDYFKPLCDLQALNAEYAAALMYKRRMASPLAPPVHPDGNMLAGTVLHNQQMAEKDSLFHDYLTFHAELIGTLIEADEFRGNPRKLAQYIWTRFNNSPLHDAIQRNPSLCYVSISCSNRYFVVRLDDHPGVPIKEQFERYRLWQLHSASAGK